MSVARAALGYGLYYSAATIGSQLRGCCCCCWKGSRDIANPSSRYFQISATSNKILPFCFFNSPSNKRHAGYVCVLMSSIKHKANPSHHSRSTAQFRELRGAMAGHQIVPITRGLSFSSLDIFNLEGCRNRMLVRFYELEAGKTKCKGSHSIGFYGCLLAEPNWVVLGLAHFPLVSLGVYAGFREVVPVTKYDPSFYPKFKKYDQQQHTHYKGL
ncbi:hypothetical protein C5167_035161 [Papaver somniferum]|uniref:Uncharacterized protein n=1 Tax=Papaver somniferum TaxID=3469 RepID=A0A4Y7KI28_PAPSO|nr:hypothetical protein C5167_035161 [Papaver somniferum]